ncbi:hypothetical protein [Micromonospora wenchangensis]|uniref:hypothetical protein n=1 Tax=Micromonospora wenchangensis TaxID=1185415 RepID=UPI003D708DB4
MTRPVAGAGGGAVRRLLVLAVTVLLGATGCHGAAGPPSAGAGGDAPAAGTPSVTATDLSALLLRPAGYTGVPGDPLSGPIGRDDLGRIFVERPGDPAAIVGHGFVAGHVDSWKAPVGSLDPEHPVIGETTLLTAVVLRFDSSANATAMGRYFDRPADGYRRFVVPAALGHGYGFQRGPDELDITYLSVTWVHGTLLLQLVLQQTGTPPDPDRVVALAVAQDRAL